MGQTKQFFNQFNSIPRTNDPMDDRNGRILDYEELIKVNGNLEKYYDRGTNKFNYKSNEAVIELNKTLFKHRLGINLELSNKHLCPRFFNRLDYIEFIYKLLKLSTLPNQDDQPLTNERFFGLDIGTGHAAIYPLSAIKYFSLFGINKVRFIGTDINKESIELAIDNVKLNNLLEQIEIQKVETTSGNSYSCLVNNVANSNCKSFTMCNPPFYSSYSELKSKQEFKKKHIDTVTAIHSELITEGGEVEFVKKLIEDSLGNDNIDWFTTLIGSFQTITAIYQSFGTKIDFGVYQFKSGISSNGTTRWILFWTFTKHRPPHELFNNTKVIKNKNKVIVNKKGDLNKLKQMIEELEYIHLSSNKIEGKILVGFSSNVWSRSYRRRFKNKRHKLNAPDEKDEVWIQVKLLGETTLLLWKYGLHYKLFESFCTFLSKSL